MCTFVIDHVKAGLNDTAVQATILDKLLQVRRGRIVMVMRYRRGTQLLLMAFVGSMSVCLPPLSCMLQVCSNLPADLVTKCSDLVRQYGESRLQRCGQGRCLCHHGESSLVT